MFEIGDRVQVSTTVGNYCLRNQYGTIIGRNGMEPYDYLVEFDNDVGGHDGYERATCNGKDGHCWYVYENELDLINYLKGEDLLKILEGKQI